MYLNFLTLFQKGIFLMFCEKHNSSQVNSHVTNYIIIILLTTLLPTYMYICIYISYVFKIYTFSFIYRYVYIIPYFCAALKILFSRKTLTRRIGKKAKKLDSSELNTQTAIIIQAIKIIQGNRE